MKKNCTVWHGNFRIYGYKSNKSLFLLAYDPKITSAVIFSNLMNNLNFIDKNAWAFKGNVISKK